MKQELEIDGVRVPLVGFGTWQMTGREARDGVADALAAGYRHVDTARMYGNEREVADAIGSRDDVFITTKIWPSDFEPQRLRKAAQDSARNLPRIDLLLLHWPSDSLPLEPTIDALRAVQEAGLTRLIGVSNFGPELLQRARELAPVVNDQIELHPYVSDGGVLDVEGIFVTAYSPLDKGRAARDPDLREIGEAHGKSAGQVALRFLLQEGVAVIPKAASAERRRENLELFDFELSPQEISRIRAKQNGRN